MSLSSAICGWLVGPGLSCRPDQIRKAPKAKPSVQVMESGHDSESEYKVLSELQHPNIVGLHEAGFDGFDGYGYTIQDAGHK